MAPVSSLSPAGTTPCCIWLPFPETSHLVQGFHEDISPHLIVVGYGDPNGKLHRDNGKPSLLPVIFLVKFLCSLFSSTEWRFLQTFFPASSQRLRIKCLLVGCFASSLIHVYFFNLKDDKVKWILRMDACSICEACIFVICLIQRKYF